MHGAGASIVPAAGMLGTVRFDARLRPGQWVKAPPSIFTGRSVGCAGIQPVMREMEVISSISPWIPLSNGVGQLPVRLESIGMIKQLSKCRGSSTGHVPIKACTLYLA